MSVAEPDPAVELVRAEAEAEANRAKARLHEVEARKVAAEAAKAEHEAEVASIALAREQEKRRRELAADEHHHVYVFDGSVTPSSVKACMTQLNQWARNDPGCAIEVVFNSPGGSVIDGMALWDHIQSLRAKGHEVTTVALGYAASMAGILLQAGDRRVMGRESYLMLHEASFSAGGKIGEVDDTVEWVKRVCDRILDIFAARSKLTKAQIKRKWTRKDWWLDSSEALKLGFVDEVR